MSRRNGQRQYENVGAISACFDEACKQWKTRKGFNAEAYYRASQPSRSETKRTDVSTGGISADYHYDSEYQYFRIVELARALDRDDVLIGQGISRAIGNIVQNGFRLDPQTGNNGADKLLRFLWSEWCDSRTEADFEREKTFQDMERLILRHIIVDGDTVVLPTDTGGLQIVENHRLRTPRGAGVDLKKTIHGVELNQYRQRVRYWLAKDDIPAGERPDTSSAVAYPAFDDRGNRLLYHLFYPKRTTQTRGVSRLCPIAHPAAMHDDVQFAKLVQQQVVSVFAMARQRPQGWEPPEGYEEPYTYEADPCRPGEMRPMANLSAGMWYTGLPGEQISAFSSNVPNPTFFDHAKQIQQIMAINLDLPLIVFLLDASETNFSGWRGAMEQAKIMFRQFQMWFASVFHSEVYRWKIRQWSTPGTSQSNDLLVAMRQRGVPLFSHSWLFPTWPYIEPLKDATADLLEIANGLTSPRRLHGKRGQEWQTVAAEIVEDFLYIITLAAEAAEQFNTQFADQPHVDWRELARLPMPQGSQMGLDQVLQLALEGQANGQQGTQAIRNQ